MSNNARYDKDQVKQAASGRWIDILVAVAGIPIEILDSSREHPCCKCGGETRFRLVDEDAGAVYCNNCLTKNNGDGFAAIMWMTGCSFPEAVEKVAQFLGIEPTKTKKKSSKKKEKLDPSKDLEPMKWASGLAKRFTLAKPGVTEESLLAQGCFMARYKNRMTVIVFPIIGPDLDTDNPKGYVIMDHGARCNIPRYKPTGEFIEFLDKKIMPGSDPGIIGVDAINKMKTNGLVETVWKCEGITDQAAWWAAIPENVRARQAVVTLSNGAQQNLKWQGDVLSYFNVNILHDCDQPGQAGAIKAGEFLGGRVADGKEIRNVVLPYDIEPNHGKDVRDWVNEGNTYGDMLNLVAKSTPIAIARNEDGSAKEEEQTFPIHEMIMDKLQLRIMEVQESGACRVFSMLLRKPSTIPQVSRLKKEDMNRICGGPAVSLISKDPDHEETWGMDDVRESIGLACSKHDINKQLHGVGAWQGLDESGNESDAVVLVNNTSAVRWDSNKVLQEILEPQTDGLALNFGAGDKDWFDPALLEQNLKNCENLEWREKVIRNTTDLFARWKWRHQDVDPLLITGLALSTWIQTLWKWRPLVSIVGESESGKSFLFQALGGSDQQLGIFGRLAFKQSKSTEAGIRQFVRQTGMVIICDEFEASKERVKILEMMRSSTRGDMVARGTAGDQRGKMFALQHICWTAAIEAGLHRQPDMNRFIQFDVFKPERAMHGKLILPKGPELYDLGQKLLAISVFFAIEAKNLAVRMKDTKTEIDARRVESYAVPAAILGLAMGFDESQCRTLLKQLVEITNDKDAQGESDQVELLDAIFSSTIFCSHPYGTTSVAQILEDTRSSRYSDNAAKLEAAGIRLFEGEGLFINTKRVSEVLLRGTAWEGQRIDQILMRLPGVERSRKRLARMPLRGVIVSEQLFRSPPDVE